MLRHQRRYDHAEAPNTGGLPPPVEVDPAQESLSQALRAGFNVLRVIIVVLLIAFTWGFTTALTFAAVMYLMAFVLIKSRVAWR